MNSRYFKQYKAQKAQLMGYDSAFTSFHKIRIQCLVF